MKEFKYRLWSGSKKNKCPQCGQKTFTTYIDNGTGEWVASYVGRCDRENNCGYHYTPKNYFSDNPQAKRNETINVSWAAQQPNDYKPVSHLPFELMERSVNLHERSCFYEFLAARFTRAFASDLCKDYFIGTNKAGNTVFFQVDINGKIRQGKVMQYDSSTGRRNKNFNTHFIGKAILNNQEANFQQCFFGEYLLNNPSKPVAIVESEKTAVIASIYFPAYTWLATGGKYGARFTEAKTCKVLAGRDIIMFPDVKAYPIWREKGELIQSVAGCNVVVSNLLHNMATDSERNEDSDLADYLLKKIDSTGLALTDYGYPVIWDLKK